MHVVHGKSAESRQGSIYTDVKISTYCMRKNWQSLEIFEGVKMSIG